MMRHRPVPPNPTPSQRTPSTLFAWFACAVAGDEGALGRPQPPREALDRLGVPRDRYPWLEAIADREVAIREQDGVLLPDLQHAPRAKRRAAGQYFTPEPFVTALAAQLGLVDDVATTTIHRERSSHRGTPARRHAVLDPACGDGGFLVPLVRRGLAQGGDRSLRWLSGFDIDGEALLVCLGRLIALAGGWSAPGPDLQQRDFLRDPPEPGRFALVVGNPPYRVNLPEEQRRELVARYVTSEGEKDLYTFFLEGGCRALAPGGRMVLLTSHTWLVNHQCGKIRRYLFADHRVEALFFLPYRFFADAPGVMPVVTVVRHEAAQGDIAIHSAYDRNTCSFAVHRSLSGSLVRDPAGSADQRTTQAPVAALAAALLPAAVASAFAAMEAHQVCLGTAAKIGVGIQESLRTGEDGRRSVFVADRRVTPRHRPVLRGREVVPFGIRWDGKFIDYGDHLAYRGDPLVWAGPKLLYQNIRNETLPTRLVVAHDESGFVAKNSLSYIVNTSEPYSLWTLLGLLNSRLVNLWFRQRHLSFHVTVTAVRTIPLPPAHATAALARVADQARHLAALVARPAVPPAADLAVLERAVFLAYFGPGTPENSFIDEVFQQWLDLPQVLC